MPLEIHKRDSNPLNIKTLSKYEYQLIYNYNTAARSMTVALTCT